MALIAAPRKASVRTLSLVAAIVSAFVALTDARQEIAVTSLIMSSDHSVDLCTFYYPEFKPLPQGPDAADVLHVISFTSQSSCEKPYGIDLKDKVVLIHDTGNCTLQKAMQIYKDARAYGIMIGLATNKIQDIIVEKTASSVTDLVLIFAENRTAAFLEEFMIPKQPYPAKFFTKDFEFEPALAVIWFLAVFSVGVGSYWSGNVRHQVYEFEVHCRQMRRRRLSSSGGSAASQAPSRPQGMSFVEEESSLDITPIWVISYIVLMAAMLVILYFLIRYLGLFRL